MKILKIFDLDVEEGFCIAKVENVCELMTNLIKNRESLVHHEGITKFFLDKKTLDFLISCSKVKIIFFFLVSKFKNFRKKKKCVILIKF